jgi:hypothetical protein
MLTSEDFFCCHWSVEIAIPAPLHLHLELVQLPLEIRHRNTFNPIGYKTCEQGKCITNSDSPDSKEDVLESRQNSLEGGKRNTCCQSVKMCIYNCLEWVISELKRPMKYSRIMCHMSLTIQPWNLMQI